MKRSGIFFVPAGVLAFATLILIPASQSQEMPPEYQQALKILGRKGDFKANVLKVGIPRDDLQETVAGVETPTAFGFGGWMAMSKGDGGKEVMMGDLVLRLGEVSPVMSALLDHGLEVTALHDHFFWDDPRVAFLHIHGYGEAADLARRLKPALEAIARPPAVGSAAKSAPPAKPAAAKGKLDTAAIAKIVGHEGEQLGSVYKITLGRDDIPLKDMGATINARMGLNTWAAFVGTDAEAAIAGDVAMRENEVTPVLKALLQNGLSVVAIHHHMIGTQPMIVFLHYWGQGSAERLARGFRAALDELGKNAAASRHRTARDPKMWL